VVKSLANRAADAAVSAGSQEASKGNASKKDLAIDAIAGATVGEVATRRAAAAAEHSAKGHLLARTANRAESVAAWSSRAGRQAAV